MKNYIGKPCKLHININDADLFFSAKEVLNVTEEHITFRDKFNKVYTFQCKNVIEIIEIISV